MSVTGVVPRRARIGAGERIDESTRTQATLTRIQAGAVRVGTSYAQVSAPRAVTAEAAGVLGQGRESMLEPGLANLFEAVVIGRTPAHPVKILWNNRMVYLRQREPIEVDHSVIARGSSDSEPYLGSARAKLLHRRQISHDDIGPRHGIRNLRPAALGRRQHRRLHRAVYQRFAFDQIHVRGDRDSTGDRASFRGPSERLRELFRD